MESSIGINIPIIGYNHEPRGSEVPILIGNRQAQAPQKNLEPVKNNFRLDSRVNR